MNRWTAVIAALMVAGLARADDRINALIGDLESLSAGFEQQVVDESGRLVEESAGTFALRAPNLFRWHYAGPYEQLIVADGKRVWMHDVELEQVTVRTQDEAESSSPLSVLTRPETLSERYVVEYDTRDGLEVITLLPRVDEAEFEWVELGFRDQLLERLVIQDAFGQQTRIHFAEPQVNVALDGALFEFTPPEGVDVIGAEELLGSP